MANNSADNDKSYFFHNNSTLSSNETSALLNEQQFITSIQSTSSQNTRTLSINNTNRRNQNESGISWYFAVFLIVNAALGAGLLNFAKAYNEAGGILSSSIIQIVSINRQYPKTYILNTTTLRY
jgi:hypothetical protein